MTIGTQAGARDGDGGCERDLRARIPTGVRVALACTAMVAVALLPAGRAPAQDPTHGRHHDWGRFSAQSEGFPPQLVGASDEGTPVGTHVDRGQRAGDGPGAAEDAAVATALADQRVARRTTGRHEVIGATTADPKSERPGSVEVAVYAHDARATVLATVEGDRVVAVRSVPAGRWQPPLLGPERIRAIDLARRAWRDAGVGRAGQLDGFAIHALEPDGTPFDTRMAYVTFHASVDARPELSSWVDLTAGRVVRDGVQARPQGDGPPRVRGDAGQGGDAVVGVRPGRIAGDLEWHGWTFGYEVSNRVDGVSLTGGSYQGVEVFHRLSLPVMTVFYDHPPGTSPDEVCGPYVDRLGPPELTPVPWFDDEPLVLRELTMDGVAWLEIGILDTLGNYVLYQSWYISEDGQIDGHTFAKGVQCEFDHVHYPFWRLDLDVAGPGGDRITRALPDGSAAVMPTEFDASATDAADHGWTVSDIATGDRVRLRFDDGTWATPGEVVPEETYAGNIVFGRLAEPSEHGEWRAPASTTLGFNEGDPIDGEDVVVWYRGLLPHTAAEGPALWHSTGVRLEVELTPRYQARPGSRGWTR